MTKEYKGSLDAALKIGANIVTGRCTITSTETYKIDDNYIKVGKEETFEWTYDASADVHEVNMAMDAYSRASVAYSISEQKQAKGISASEAPLKLEQAATAAEATEIAKIAQEAPTPPSMPGLPFSVPEDKAPPPEVYTPPTPPPSPPAPSQGDSAAETHEILENCTISHQVTGSGIHHLLVKGGKYKKYGVFFWPEKAAEILESKWQEWPIGTAYGLPEGYTEAVVQMKPDGKPDRIVGLR